MLMFTLGGITGIILACTIIDVVLHDTLFVVAHLHFMLSIAAIIALGAGEFLL